MSVLIIQVTQLTTEIHSLPIRFVVCIASIMYVHGGCGAESFVWFVAVRRRIARYALRVMFDLFFLCIIFSIYCIHA